MGYMIHFDEEIVGAEELKLIETKKTILEKLHMRFGFGELPNRPALGATQKASTNGHTMAPGLRPHA